jgi:hypothetical protein
LGYNTWVKEHAQKHKRIVDKLLAQGYDKEAIIAYFDFENMKEKEVDFCPLYKDNKKCHDMAELNCYLCSCPNFRFSDKGIKKIEKNTQYSFCSIDSKDGEQGVYGDAIHQNCSGCTVPHHKTYVEKNFDLDWAKIMQVCSIDEKEV